MKESALLVTVNPVIGRIEIQDQLARRPLKRSDELIHHDLVDRYSGFPGGVTFVL